MSLALHNPDETPTGSNKWSSQNPRHAHPDSSAQFRARLYADLLTDVAREQPGNENLIRLITLRDILSSSVRHTNRHIGAENQGKYWAGLLAAKDLANPETPSRIELDPFTERHLREALDALIQSISEFLHGESEGPILDTAWTLPEDIRAHSDALTSAQENVAAVSRQIQQLTTESTELHARLHEDLVTVLSKFPPILHAKQSASNDLLATTIETSLIKLSLLRARAHRALYDYRSPSNPQANTAQALLAAHSKLKRDERRLDEEERALDHQLDEYEQLLQLVDGGGFAQVVEDWARVQKETDECKRDLRRLGWTGD